MPRRVFSSPYGSACVTPSEPTRRSAPHHASSQQWRPVEDATVTQLHNLAGTRLFTRHATCKKTRPKVGKINTLHRGTTGMAPSTVTISSTTVSVKHLHNPRQTSCIPWPPSSTYSTILPHSAAVHQGVHVPTDPGTKMPRDRTKQTIFAHNLQ